MLIWPTTCVAGDASSSASVHAPVIALDLSGHYLNFDDVLCGDWPSFDAILSSLSHVHKVIFGFKTSEDMSRFGHKTLEPSMTHLRTKLECQYALLHHERWDQATDSWGRFFVSADPEKAAGA